MRYDATLKKLFRDPPNRLLSFALGKPVNVVRMLPTDLITVENLHPDLLFEDDDGELIHAELHGYAMIEFACRNLIYFGLLLRDFKRPPRQVVFWIGRDRVGVSAGLSYPPELQYTYRVIDVRDIDARMLLAEGGVGESIFAILCKVDDPRELIGEILRRIGALPAAEQREAVAQLLVLSGLRGLKAVVQEEVSHMPLSFDIHENEFLEEVFQEGHEKGLLEGKEKGLLEGKEKGLVEGKEKGRLETARQLLTELLEAKFGALPPATRELISEASFERIQLWQRRVLGTDSLSALFAKTDNGG